MAAPSPPSQEPDLRNGSVGLAIPAAGSGTRMGGRRKPFLELAGEPILIRALRPFLDHPRFVAFAVALGEDQMDNPPSWLVHLDPRIQIVPGGESRGESVWAAIQALPEDVSLLAVHDAARPLVTREVIDRCLDEVEDGQGAVAGWPAVDTLKRVEAGGRVVETLPRQEIWHAQTPQVFPRSLLVQAYQTASREGSFDTDDSALVERAGGDVKMVRGSAKNIKITRPHDLVLAEAYLREASGG